MVANAIGFLLQGGVNLLVLVLGLLPTVDVSSLPLAVPQEVSSVLGYLNWFIPIGDLITILTVWIGLVIAVNAVFFVMDIVKSVKG